MTYQNPQFLIEADELAGRLGDENLRIFDASIHFDEKGPRSGREDYREGHVAGAAFVDLLTDVSDPAAKLNLTLPGAEFLEAALRKAGISDENEVVVYSRGHSMWATRLWWILHYAGHKTVRLLHGGYRGWTDAGHPTTTGDERYPAGTMSVHLRPDRFADKEEVLKGLGQKNVCTVHTLSHEMYLGEGSQNYGRPGHITGSISLPYNALMQRDRFRSAEELQAALQEKGLLEAGRVITYCGGGVAATIDAFACLLLGKDEIAVYDGSLSEWSADESLPMTTGPAPGA